MPAEVLQALVFIEDAQTNFRTMRLSVAICMTLLLRISPPDVTIDAEEEYSTLLKLALA